MKILKNLNWNPVFVNNKGQEIQYEKKWYCTEKKKKFMVLKKNF